MTTKQDKIEKLCIVQMYLGSLIDIIIYEDEIKAEQDFIELISKYEDNSAKIEDYLDECYYKHDKDEWYLHYGEYTTLKAKLN